jgi:hypothetical protein
MPHRRPRGLAEAPKATWEAEAAVDMVGEAAEGEASHGLSLSP